MRLLVCGSRGWTDREAIHVHLAGLNPAESIVIHGKCRGADIIAGEIAQELGLHVAEVPALWDYPIYGKQAGFIRNHAMVKLLNPDRVVAFTLGTRGTKDTIDRAKALGVPVEEVRGVDELGQFG